MDCPQCDDALVTYELEGREAFVCEGCGYVGIDASHDSEPVQLESWDDAIQRFHQGTARTDGDGDDDE